MDSSLTCSGSLPRVRDRLRLLCLSFLLLFVELALIRWAGSNVVYLSYFSNFVLLGSFLGIGLGFMQARHGARLFPWAPVALALFVAFVHHYHVEIDRSGGQLIYFGSFEPTGLPIWLTLPIVFICVAVVMGLIAAEAARVFARFPPLDSYRIDIAGSILGICAFSLLSFLGWPPLAWGVVVASLFGLLLPRRLVVLPALCTLLVMVAALERESQPAWSDRSRPVGRRTTRSNSRGIPITTPFRSTASRIRSSHPSRTGGGRRRSTSRRMRGTAVLRETCSSSGRGQALTSRSRSRKGRATLTPSRSTHACTSSASSYSQTTPIRIRA